MLLPLSIAAAAHSGSKGSSQVVASARLLLVLVARSLVLVHDAMAAVAAAAGTAPDGLLGAAIVQVQLGPADKDIARLSAIVMQASGRCSSLHPLVNQKLQQARYAWKDVQRATLEAAERVMGTLQQPSEKQEVQDSCFAQQQPAAWPHLLQLHAVPKLAAAVRQMAGAVSGCSLAAAAGTSSRDSSSALVNCGSSTMAEDVGASSTGP
jgi:hypothetical protein